MRSQRAAQAPVERAARPSIEAAILGFFVLAIPLVVATDQWDSWRLPKELAFRAEAILLLLAGVFAATAPDSRWRSALRQVPRREWAVCGAAAAWTAVTTLTSTNPPLSRDAAVTVAASLVVYLATRIVAPRLGWLALDVCFAAAAANAAVVTCQELGVWNPFSFASDVAPHLRATGFLGNPNEVGSFLSGITMAAIVATSVARGRRRWLYAAVSALLLSGLLASATRTAILALCAGVFAFSMTRPLRQRLAVLIATVLLVGGAVAASNVLRENTVRSLRALGERRYDQVFSQRLVPFLAAVEMARAHPVTGVGPGCFKVHYMPERLALRAKYPAVWMRGWPEQFAETHNDHLQVLAETGVPGYAIFLAAIGVVVLRWPARGGPRPAGDDAEPGAESGANVQRLGNALRVPLATVFFVLCLAQFPLQIAAPRLMFLTLAALVNGWENADA